MFHTGGRGGSSWRGTHRGSRGGSRGGFRGLPYGRDEPAVVPPTGKLLLSITHADLMTESHETDSLRISNCEYVASYSWLGGVEPRIYVPGKISSCLKCRTTVI